MLTRSRDFKKKMYFTYFLSLLLSDLNSTFAKKKRNVGLDTNCNSIQFDVNVVKTF